MILIFCNAFFPGDLADALWCLHDRFKTWLRDRRLSCSMKRWGLRTICYESGEFPTLASYVKGAKTRLILKWAADEAEWLVANVSDTHRGRTRAKMMRCLVTAIRVCERSDTVFLSDADCTTFVHNSRAFLLHLQSEVEASSAAGELLFKLRPKLHYWAESVEHVSRNFENPAHFDCFDWESFVGRIKRIVCRTHRLAASRRAVERYLIALAVRWHRGW
jgi:hypothetical protein